MKSRHAAALAFLLLTLTTEPSRAANPDKGFVPDEQTAIAIAVAVWTPIYGAELIRTEAPYKASLVGDVWTVTGTLPARWTHGGTAIAEISKKTGCILNVTHGK